ncbi:unnamed protein product, partial [Symbiodinium sp. KB8]
MSEISQIGRLCANERCNFLVTFEESGGFCCKRCYTNHVRFEVRCVCERGHGEKCEKKEARTPDIPRADPVKPKDPLPAEATSKAAMKLQSYAQLKDLRCSKCKAATPGLDETSAKEPFYMKKVIEKQQRRSSMAEGPKPPPHPPPGVVRSRQEVWEAPHGQPMQRKVGCSEVEVAESHLLSPEDCESCPCVFVRSSSAEEPEPGVWAAPYGQRRWQKACAAAYQVTEESASESGEDSSGQPSQKLARRGADIPEGRSSSSKAGRLEKMFDLRFEPGAEACLEKFYEIAEHNTTRNLEKGKYSVADLRFRARCRFGYSEDVELLDAIFGLWGYGVLSFVVLSHLFRFSCPQIQLGSCLDSTGPSLMQRLQRLQSRFGSPQLSAASAGAVLGALDAPPTARFVVGRLREDYCEPQGRLERFLRSLKAAGYTPRSLTVDVGAYCPQRSAEAEVAECFTAAFLHTFGCELEGVLALEASALNVAETVWVLEHALPASCVATVELRQHAVGAQKDLAKFSGAGGAVSAELPGEPRPAPSHEEYMLRDPQTGKLQEPDQPQRFTEELVTLDTLLDGRGAIDILKVDVDGQEPCVVRGADATLRAGRVAMVIFEVSDLWRRGPCAAQGFPEVVAHFDRLQYDVFLLGRPGKGQMVPGGHSPVPVGGMWWHPALDFFGELSELYGECWLDAVAAKRGTGAARATWAQVPWRLIEGLTNQTELAKIR